MEESPKFLAGGSKTEASAAPAQAKPTTPPSFPAQPSQKPAVDNFLAKTLKEFMNETKDQYQCQGGSSKNLENQIGQIAKTMSARPSGS